MRARKLIVALAVLTVVPAMMPALQASAAPADKPGSCGEYMYWRDGKCVDARNRDSAQWSEQMSRKPAW